ncbi:MAG: heavy metal translocating P-type ATPase [Negativicutes bacterium]|nr:heavy metal translocating P-type ATPase [Negativicutes bacterium]
MQSSVISSDGFRLLPGRLRLSVDGLRNNRAVACYLVRRMNATTGIKKAEANPLTGRVLIYFEPQRLTLADIQQGLARCRSEYLTAIGEIPAKTIALWASSPAGREAASTKESTVMPGEKGPLFYTVATGGILAAILLKRLVVGPSPLAASQRVFNLAAITTLVSGFPLLRDGLGQLAHRRQINSELLIFAATLILLALRESITGLSVLWIVHLSNLFRSVIEGRTKTAIRKMMAEDYGYAMRWTGGQGERVKVQEIKSGDILLVQENDVVPVDGEIVAGEAVISQAIINGSSALQTMGSGDHILAGTTVSAGCLRIRASQKGREPIDAGIAKARGKADIEVELLSDRTERYSNKLVTWTLALAGLTYLFTRDISRSLAVLLAGCPVAVALSRHMALGSALAVAAHNGIYVKDAKSFSTLNEADTVLFDKTGTLTAAMPEVIEISLIDKAYHQGDLIQLAASAVASTKHPVAMMLVEQARQTGLDLLPADSKEVVGAGVLAMVAGQQMVVGHEDFISQQKVKIARANPRIRRMQQLGLSVLFVAINTKLVGLVGYSSRLLPETSQAINRLRSLGIGHIGLVTGDTPHSAKPVTEALGLDEEWSVSSPQDKLELILRLQSDGRRVVMVGDGINDAAALAAANAGITLGCGGTDAPARSADIIVKGSDIRKIPHLIHLSKYTGEIIQQNLTGAAGLSTAGLALAIGGLITPVSAMMLLNVATVLVLANSTRVLRHRQRPSNQPVMDLQRFNSLGPDLPIAYQQSYDPGCDSRDGEAGVPVADSHLQPAQVVCERLATSDHYGLSESEARLRQIQYGLNRLEEAKRPGFWQLLYHQFKDLMVQILLGAAGLSFVLGRSRDALLTLVIVAANAILGVVQERKAESSLAALQKMAAPQARIIRGGSGVQIASEQLVPGDIICLEAGDRVPADARLISTWRFEVEEASLTGETVPASKDALFIAMKSLTLGDRKNMVYMGTSVTRGRATAVVVATGMSTEMGQVARLIQCADEQVTPLQRRLEELAKYLVYGCLAISGIVFIAGLLRGLSPLFMLQIAASLAVAAIPEGLSAIVIIALAMGVQRMSRRNIIVRKLSSIETLGCATVICSDKTGTLTKNEMTVRGIYTVGRDWKVGGEGYLPIGSFECNGALADPSSDDALMQTLLTGALCNNARLIHDKAALHDKVVSIEEHKASGWKVDGDPTEGALLVVAAKAGMWRQALDKSSRRIDENPFESERRMMSVVCSGQGSKKLYCKGALDRIVGACGHVLHNGAVLPLDEKIRQEIIDANDRMTDRALRVLAFAYRPISADEQPGEILERESELIFCGLVGMIDPPRPEVPAAIAKCQRAGVKVVMITGDHPKTAAAVAREIKLLSADGRMITGTELDGMTDAELADVVGEVAVYARTSPHHKLRIIKALKAKGYVVAMTGDGVNDAPAVKVADIGIAMGLMGTDVTKEAASVTLADDNFATIVKAMEEGRSIYANIRKAIRYLIATNIGEVILMLLAVLMGLPLPLIPIQLLWINLIGDGLPAVALVNDPPAHNIMQQPPRSADDSVFSGGLGSKILSRGLAIGVTSLALFTWALKASRNLVLARTIVIAQLAISQFIHIFDCRLERHTGKVGLFSNRWLVAAVALSMAMIGGIIHVPVLQPVFGTTALSLAQWLVALLVAGLTAVLDWGLSEALNGWTRGRGGVAIAPAW